METNIDYEDIKTFWKTQLDSKVIDYAGDGLFTIDLSRILRDDLSINLELVEVLVEQMCNYGVDVINLSNRQGYLEARGLENRPSNETEELGFIKRLVETLSVEFNDTDNKIEVNYI